MSTVLGHRGASGQHRGNTLEAFRAAYDQGAAGIEFDVRRSADEALVIHHDPVLADGRAIIDIERADLPDHIPTLADVIAVSCAQRPDPVLNIEIKSDPDEPDFDDTYRVVDAVLDVVAPARLAEAKHAEIWMTSFDPAVIAAVRSVDPSIATGQIGETLLDVDGLVAAGHRAVMMWLKVLTADYVAAAHAAGLRVGVWTVNEHDDLKRMVDFGVDWLMTDFPARAVAVAAGTS